MISMTSFRKHLSAPGLLSIIYRQFSKIPDPREFSKDVSISIADHFMSGLAVFGLKCPSLLDYDRKRSDNVIAQNLRDLYLVNNPPSDTYLRGGRARWKIENETFNTLKNLGYNFEHNYGHGKKYLSTVLCLLMMLAFLVDQVQEICCSLFQQCRKFAGTYRYLWETMRTLFHFVRLVDWANFYLMLSKGKPLNTS